MEGRGLLTQPPKWRLAGTSPRCAHEITTSSHGLQPGSASVYGCAWLPGAGRAWHTVSMIGPHGEKRPADPIANALHVARLFTGEDVETYVNQAKQAGGRKGGEARAKALTPTERRLIAQLAAKARHQSALT